MFSGVSIGIGYILGSSNLGELPILFFDSFESINAAINLFDLFPMCSPGSDSIYMKSMITFSFNTASSASTDTRKKQGLVRIVCQGSQYSFTSSKMCQCSGCPSSGQVRRMRLENLLTFGFRMFSESVKSLGGADFI